MMMRERALPINNNEVLAHQWFDYKNQIEIVASFVPLLKFNMPSKRELNELNMTRLSHRVEGDDLHKSSLLLPNDKFKRVKNTS